VYIVGCLSCTFGIFVVAIGNFDHDRIMSTMGLGSDVFNDTEELRGCLRTVRLFDKADFSISLAGADSSGLTADGHLMHTDPCLFFPFNIYFRVMRLQLSYSSESIREPKGMRGAKQKSAPA
jgi:hypothetical protein